ncbi:uncharacterized protein LOC114359771 [Ostrinia furnacalis]|uniref:uncharacterized protein LOC114359771 n=1 Tax=Ostrinia furnacalis TaxID=93504 RepID=UPI00103C3C5B|nr:uncharacterized protein LOC114359771 [Ostrinia furnacalis]XP_028170081.1 uncharacterized protein LOC114359771 [Ostrinia furnacalis]
MNKLSSLLGMRRLLDFRSISTRITADGKEVPKRKTFENRITLIGIDNSVSITDLKNAENLSLRRELKLVKIQDEDSKTRRPVYKLMTNAEYHAEVLERRKEKQESRQKNSTKGQKILSISSKIGEHDLMTGVKKIIKLLDKQYEVKIIISGDGDNAATTSERIYSVIEKNTVSSGKAVQKRNKGNSLRFQLLPLRENSSQSQDDSDSNKNKDDKGPL